MAKARFAVLALLTLGLTLTAPGQGRPDPETLLKAQREAMAPLAFMDGVWRGPAWTILSSGEKHNITQTERIGPFLDGAVKVIEGRGYNPDGSVGFNAFGTISYNPATRVTRCTPMRKVTSATSCLTAQRMVTSGRFPRER